MKTRQPSTWWCFCWKTKENHCEFYQQSEDSSACVYKVRGKCGNSAAVKEGWANVTALKRLEDI